MPEYTVVAAYRDPPSIYCHTVEADDPGAAVDAAWAACLLANWGEDAPVVEMEDEWADAMVIVGAVEVVA